MVTSGGVTTTIITRIVVIFGWWWGCEHRSFHTAEPAAASRSCFPIWKGDWSAWKPADSCPSLECCPRGALRPPLEDAPFPGRPPPGAESPPRPTCCAPGSAPHPARRGTCSPPEAPAGSPKRSRHRHHRHSRAGPLGRPGLSAALPAPARGASAWPRTPPTKAR